VVLLLFSTVYGNLSGGSKLDRPAALGAKPVAVPPPEDGQSVTPAKFQLAGLAKPMK